MTWSFGFCGLDGADLGEVKYAYERKLTLPLNGLPTASVRLRPEDPLVDELSTLRGDALMKVYQDSTLRFIGEIMSVEEVGGDNGVTVQVTAAGPFWRLKKRLFGTPYPTATQSYTNTDADQIIKGMLDQANTGWDTGIRWDATSDTLYETTVGVESSWSLKPVAEAIAEMQASKVPVPLHDPPPAFYFALDTFGGSGSVDGRTDDEGNTWDSYGTTPDWSVGSGAAFRIAASASLDGRIAANSATGIDTQLVGMEFRNGVPSSTGYADALYTMLYARYDGLGTATVPEDGTWLRLVIQYSNVSAPGGARCLLQKSDGSGPITLGQWDPGGLTTQTYRAMILVDDSGNYSAWLEDPASPQGPSLTGNDPDLAAGGAIDVGTLAFGDHAGAGATTATWVYERVWGFAYPGPQSFDFEIAPQEPAADTVPYPGSMPVIGNLRVKLQIGSEKPNAVFEYGEGARSVKSYRRVIDRDGLVTQAYSLPADFPTGTDVRYATNWDALEERGALVEVIPSDLSDGLLRQALIENHAVIRGEPRQIITFEPSSTAPQFGTDYIVGDFVVGRAKVNGEARFNAQFRVYAVEVTIDEEGRETVTPTLVPE